MRVNIILFWVLTGFFVVADLTYVIWNWVYNAQQLATKSVTPPGTPVEWAGTTALGLCAVLSAFIAFYLSRVHRAQGAELPEDRLNATIDDGDPELGFYSPFSWWPIVLAASLALIFLGLAVGFWLAYFSVGIFLIALVGWIYEYYRGYFAR